MKLMTCLLVTLIACPSVALAQAPSAEVATVLVPRLPPAPDRVAAEAVPVSRRPMHKAAPAGLAIASPQLLRVIAPSMTKIPSRDLVPPRPSTK